MGELSKSILAAAIFVACSLSPAGIAAAQPSPSEKSASTSPKEPAEGEITFWESIRDSKSAEEFKAYLAVFPNGLYAPLAKSRLTALTAKPAQPENRSATPAHERSAKPAKKVAGDAAAAYFRDGFNALQANRTQDAIDKFTAGLIV